MEIGLVILLHAFRTPHEWPYISCDPYLYIWVPYAQIIHGRMTDGFINWHSSHEKWPLLFLLCQIWLTGTPNSVKPLLNGALGNISMGPRLTPCKKAQPPQNLQTPSVVLTLSWHTQMSHHGKNLKNDVFTWFFPFFEPKSENLPLTLKGRYLLERLSFHM